MARGSLEFIEAANIQQVTPEEILENSNTSEVFCNLSTTKYVSNNEGNDFN